MIGCYAFTAPDWREKEYPLDLWLQHSVELFDEVAIVTYGEMRLPFLHPKILTSAIEPIPHDSYEFWRRGKKAAQDLLTTDWKVMLDIDEFLSFRIETSYLKQPLVYSLSPRHLYGNLDTEIRGLPTYRMARVHHGEAKVSHDTGVVEGKRALGSSVGVYWHTTFLRSPTAFSLQRKPNIEAEAKEGFNGNARLLPLVEKPFDYADYRKAWPRAYLTRVTESLPEILLDHRSRFDVARLDDVVELTGRLKTRDAILWALGYAGRSIGVG